MKFYSAAPIPLLLALSLAGVNPVLEQMPGTEPEPVNAEELQAMIVECNSCHGPNGVSHHADTPSLAGQTVDEIVEAIERFNFYERHCPSTTPRYGEKANAPLNMCELSGRINEAQARALGEHYAARKTTPCEKAKANQ